MTTATFKIDDPMELVNPLDLKADRKTIERKKGGVDPWGFVKDHKASRELKRGYFSH
jgi:hypothetical protein